MTPTVLALRALGLGDALTGVPALRGLRRAFPAHRLVLAAPEPVGAWLHHRGVVDAVLPTAGLAPLHWEGPAPVAVNLHGHGPQSHRLLQALRPQQLIAFGCPAADHLGPAWRADEHEVLRWCRLVRSAGGDCGPEDLRLSHPAGATRSPDTVVVHPGAASGSRRWPVERWAPVARALLAQGYQVVLTGSRAEAGLCARIAEQAPGARSTAGRLDLAALTACVAGAGVVLCGDTGVAHLATALATPSVLLFGPTPPHRWGPAVDPHLHTVLWPGDPATPAWGDPHAEALDPRLAAVTVAEVLQAVRGLVGGPVRPTAARPG
ncbi:glycosyltransferase family 9 protein [Rhodococcus sp. X156]|uniref:glycosyltransferase family 9 protein n=1 Tax=Rhodococcus sp. X156 TaxID=2499145 RepID=UPI001F49FD0F|nr:glycosyltransferase family 9 protein [Rhodococcus sp. X156]